MKLNIRNASIQDLDAITAIYNDAVLKTTATFDTEPKTIEEQRERFVRRSARHPVFVAEQEGEIVGWASLNPWSERIGYADTAEVSFYVTETKRGGGIGRQLLAHLDQAAVQLGHHTLVSRIAEESRVSIHLHEALGFGRIGIMKEVGRKFGRLLNVVLMQKVFNN